LIISLYHIKKERRAEQVKKNVREWVRYAPLSFDFTVKKDGRVCLTLSREEDLFGCKSLKKEHSKSEHIPYESGRKGDVKQ